jgi:hypothetical protein
MIRELREEAFRQGKLAPEQTSVSVQVAERAELPQTKDGYVLVADLGSLLTERLQAHENGVSTESRQVLACNFGPNGEIQFRSFTVLGPPRNPQPHDPLPIEESHEPADVNPAPTERPQQPPDTAGGRALVRPGPVFISSGPVPPPAQQPLEFKGTALHERMNRDKDTHLVLRVLRERKKGRINTHEELDTWLKGAQDQIRVRRMIALTDSNTPPEATRHGQVQWNDVEGIKGYLPFCDPEMVVGRVVGAFGPTGSPAPATVKLDLLWALHPEKSKDSSFFRPKRTGPLTIELHVESVEVGLRLVQFWGRGKVRLKLTVSRGVELHGRFRRTVAEVYPEGLNESELRAQADWVARELARVAPASEEWFAPEPTQADVEKNADEP